MRILIAEDEKDLNMLLKKRLEENHYSVDACLDGVEALEYVSAAEYDGIILDIMMPGKDGLCVLSEMRQRGIYTPVLLLTAKDSIEDRVKGLDLGADDYLVKPFVFQELLARVRAMLRTSTRNVAASICKVANLTVHLDTYQVFRDQDEIILSNREFSILRYLVLNQGIILSQDKIEQHIWNYDYEGGSNVVSVYIRYLRKKIDDNYEPKLIHTLRGAGYVLKVNI